VGQLLTRSTGQATGGLAALGIEIVYGTVLLSVWGRTVGNRASGTRVVTAGSGRPPGPVRSFVRTAAPAALGVPALFSLPLPSAVTALVALADILWPLYDRQNRTLHDLLADTLVIRND
jgi:uncharacterized RDD family membrane protein YckC